MENLDRKQWFQDEIAKITSKSSSFINRVKCIIILLCGIPFLFKIPLGTYRLGDLIVNLILLFLLTSSYILASIVEKNIRFREISEILNMIFGISGIVLCQYFMYIFQCSNPENLFFSWVNLASIVVLALISMRYSTKLTISAAVLMIAEYAILYFWVATAIISPELKEQFIDLQTAGILQRLLYLSMASILIILFTQYVYRAMYRISDAAIELNSMKETAQTLIVCVCAVS